MVTRLNPEVIAEGSITVDKLNTNVVESLKTDSNFVTTSDLKTINGTSILGSGDITISGGSSDANVQAVDTGDVLDDVNVEYATKTYVDGLVGDINSVLESIISGGGGVSLITFTIAGTEYQAEQGMTWEQWINSEYNTDYRLYVNDSRYILPVSSGMLAVYDGFNNRHVVISDIIRANYGYTCSALNVDPE